MSKKPFDQADQFTTHSKSTATERVTSQDRTAGSAVESHDCIVAFSRRIVIWTGCGFLGWLLSAESVMAQNASVPARMPSPNSASVAPKGSVVQTSGSAEQSQIRKLRVPPGQLQALSTKLGLMYRDSSKVQITSDTRSSDLIVMAPASTQEEIAVSVRQLLAAGVSDGNSRVSAEPVQHQLRFVNWQVAEQQLAKLTGSSPSVTRNRRGQQASFRSASALMMGTTITVDRRSNRIVVDSHNGKVAAWKRVLAMIDAKPQNQKEITTIVRLENAEPAPIQRAIRLLTQAEKRSSTNRRASSPTDTQVRPAAFQPPPPTGAADNVATPEAPQDANENAEGDDADGGAGVIGDTQIEFVPELGTIIIKGAKRDVQRVMDVIKQIEEQSEVTKPDVEVVQLQHADSNAVADLLKQLYDDVLSARQGTVSITSLDAPNALLLIGRAEAIKSLLELIQKIDQPIDETNGLRVFRLQHASAVDAEQTIRDFFTDRPGSNDDNRPGLGNRIRILADYRTNSLIISASPRDMKEASRLIDELDVQQINSQSQIKVFPLSNALAEDLAPVIQEAIDGNGEGNDSNQTVPNSALSIVDLGSGAEQVLQSGILSGVLVTADSGANSIVVRGPAGSMPLIGELIRQLDRAPGIDSLVKVFTIENGDALQLTTALQNLFGDDASTAGTSIGAGNLAGLPSSTGATDSSLVPLRFSTDQRTNSIIASGSSEDLEVVESILLRLDSEGFAERITEVIWLRHQGANEVAAALQQYVQQRTQTVNTIQQFQQGLGPFDLPDRDLIVVAEPVTNSLLLSVAPRLYEDVRRLIDRLDRRPPMVLIKVVIAEVALDDTFEIGGEIGLQDGLVYDRGIASGAFAGATPPSTPGFNFNNNGLNGLNSFRQGTVAGRGLSSLGVGTTASGVSYGGFVLSAASDSVSLLLRTLQTANRLQVLSRPQVMALDNTDGFVQVGRQVARITDVITNVQNTQLVTEDIEVGLILRVRPRVGADGLIIMEVDATRSQRDPNNGTAIGQFDNGAPIIIDDILRTTAQSSVAAYSGQTVIFGGLIQKQRTNESRRVPIISEIPLVGNLFKYDLETETRNELLTILTPMLVTGEEDLDYIKQTESSRMSWCLADVVEMHGDVGLSGGYGLWGPAVGQTIYPDMQPTIDDIIIHDDYSVNQTPSAMNHSAFAPEEDVIPGSISYEQLPAETAYPNSAAPYPSSSVPNQAAPIMSPQGVPSQGLPSQGLPSQGVPSGVPQTAPIMDLPAPQPGIRQSEGFRHSDLPAAVRASRVPTPVQESAATPTSKPAMQDPVTPTAQVGWMELLNASETKK